MRLPPYGRQFDPVPRSGVRVAIGPAAWDRAMEDMLPVMVLPPGQDPLSYRWPVDDRPALVFETGPLDDRNLRGLAGSLLAAGSPFVTAIRNAMLDTDYPCVFYFPEVLSVAA